MQQEHIIQESGIKESVMESEIMAKSEMDIEKILELTLNAREKKDKFKKDLLTQDMNDAISHIAKDVESKMLEDAKKGRTYTIMYTYSDKNGKNKEFDLTNQKIRFGRSYLNTLRITKEFMDLLTEYVNKNNNSSEKLYVYFRFYHTSADVKMWNICVSWKNIVGKSLKPSQNRHHNNHFQQQNQKSYHRVNPHHNFNHSEKMDPSEKKV